MRYGNRSTASKKGQRTGYTLAKGKGVLKDYSEWEDNRNLGLAIGEKGRYLAHRDDVKECAAGCQDTFSVLKTKVRRGERDEMGLAVVKQ